jgi:hypothetical protein
MKGGVLVAAIAAAACAAGAYAAAPREGAGPSPSRQPTPAPLPRPMITQHPKKLVTSTRARFGFVVRRSDLRFQCRLDRHGWQSCRAPVVLTKLGPGSHTFSVRALDRRGRRGPSARFRWKLLEPKPFSIEPQLIGLSPLYPGAPPVALPLTVENPNPVPIRVTSLRAAATADAPECPSAANLEFIDSTVSGSAPLRVPAKASVSLPTKGISPPAIRLRDLPVNQDACQNARFPLAFFGKARG